MSASQEEGVLVSLLSAMAEVRGAIGDARGLISTLPVSPQDYAALDVPRRLATLALLKSVEQLQDLIARTLRATLTYEQVDLAGFLPRAIADQAEKAGMIASSDRWSDLVRLRNRLVHEYPIARQEQLSRLGLAWHAADELITISEGLIVYLKTLSIEERP